MAIIGYHSSCSHSQANLSRRVPLPFSDCLLRYGSIKRKHYGVVDCESAHPGDDCKSGPQCSEKLSCRHALRGASIVFALYIASFLVRRGISAKRPNDRAGCMTRSICKLPLSPPISPAQRPPKTLFLISVCDTGSASWRVGVTFFCPTPNFSLFLPAWSGSPATT